MAGSVCADKNRSPWPRSHRGDRLERFRTSKQTSRDPPVAAFGSKPLLERSGNCQNVCAEALGRDDPRQPANSRHYVVTATMRLTPPKRKFGAASSMAIYRFPDPFGECCKRVGSQFALPEPSPAATIPLGLVPSLPVASELFVPKVRGCGEP